jgi:predicted dienelactone hydrolase
MTLFIAFSIFAFAEPPKYDPLAAGEAAPTVKDVEFTDEKRSREIPLRVYLPPNQKEPAPAVLFSHGLGGSRAGSKFLGLHWAKRGYVAVFVQHPGSDEGVWRSAKIGKKMEKLKGAAGLENFKLRVEDVPAVIDQLEKWNAEGGQFAKKFDLSKVGMSGHSFGAVTTQAVSGQDHRTGKKLTEPRIKAAVVMSPSGPSIGDPKKAFGNVSIPWLLMTGTKDGSPISNMEPKDRLVVFPALKEGNKYEVVFKDAEHSVFTDHKLKGERGQRNPKHHQSILALSTGFWDAYLKGDPAAKVWLDGEGAKKTLDQADEWRKK